MDISLSASLSTIKYFVTTAIQVLVLGVQAAGYVSVQDYLNDVARSAQAYWYNVRTILLLLWWRMPAAQQKQLSTLLFIGVVGVVVAAVLIVVGYIRRKRRRTPDASVKKTAAVPTPSAVLVRKKKHRLLRLLFIIALLGVGYMWIMPMARRAYGILAFSFSATPSVVSPSLPGNPPVAPPSPPVLPLPSGQPASPVATATVVQERSLLAKALNPVVSAYETVSNRWVAMAAWLPFIDGPSDPVDGGWSDWSEWSACSRPCGGGVKKRLRSCSDPVPANGGEQCRGRSVNLANCNMHVCEAQTPQACSEDKQCFNDCGPYKDVTSCSNGTCQACATTCKTNADCDAGSAFCRFSYTEGRRVCWYNPSTPVVEEFRVTRSSTADGPLTLSWKLHPYEELHTDHLEFWCRVNDGSWTLVPGAENVRKFSGSITGTPPEPGIYECGVHTVGSGGTIYGTETLSGLQPVTAAYKNPGKINLYDYFSDDEGVYTVGYSGATVQKSDRVFGVDGPGSFTSSGGIDPRHAGFIGYGHYQYYNTQDTTSPLLVLTPYRGSESTNFIRNSDGVSQPWHAFWLMGVADGTYGELGGGQDPWADFQLRDYFMHLSEVNTPTASRKGLYYQLPDQRAYTDTYFPVRTLTFSQDADDRYAYWYHGERFFYEWLDSPHFYLGPYDHVNYGFVEPIRWSANDYLKYVNSFYAAWRKAGKDIVGTSGRTCGRETEFFSTVGDYTKLPFCPSQRLLSELDRTAQEREYNVMRFVFHEEVSNRPGSCATQKTPMMHPYQDGITLQIDEHTRDYDGYDSSANTCVYEGYLLKDYGMVIRNWASGEGHINATGFSIDIGRSGLFNFMIGAMVKGSSVDVYLLEADQGRLYKRRVDYDEYVRRGGRFIPIADHLLQRIPSR